VTGITYPNASTNSFRYNASDLRVGKTDSGGVKTYTTDGDSPASPVLSDGSAVYTPGLSERRGGASKFYHADALGSTRGMTDNTQAATDAQVFDAFGMSVSKTGTTPSPFGFVGNAQYQTDSDSGLMLLGHRYYDASVGRFISRDPAKDGTNWYAYCGNNPLKKTDPTGLIAWLLAALPIPVIGEIVAAVVVAVVVTVVIVKAVEVVADGPWYRGAPKDEDPSWDKPDRHIGDDFPGSGDTGLATPGNGPSVTTNPKELPNAIRVPHEVGEITDPDIRIVPRPRPKSPGHGQIEPKFPMPLEEFLRKLPQFLN